MFDLIAANGWQLAEGGAFEAPNRQAITIVYYLLITALTDFRPAFGKVMLAPVIFNSFSILLFISLMSLMKS